MLLINVENNVIFFSKLSEELKDFVTDEDKSVVIGGDFNVILDPDLDG